MIPVELPGLGAPMVTPLRVMVTTVFELMVLLVVRTTEVEPNAELLHEVVQPDVAARIVGVTPSAKKPVG